MLEHASVSEEEPHEHWNTFACFPIYCQIADNRAC